MESLEGSIEEPENPLFVEDRRPGNVSIVNSNLKKSPLIHDVTKSSDYISINRVEYQCSESDQPDSCKTENNVDEAVISETGKTLDDADSSETEESGDSDSGIVGPQDIVVEDKSPQLTGQHIPSPRYRICENYLKTQNGNETPKKSKFWNACFNCSETTHSIRDCPLPKNYAAIARSKREFLDAKGNTPVYKRYHVGSMEARPGAAPGELSDELRRAMGLDERELPPYIYNMRRLGYPPGWLEEACVSHSGITMLYGQDTDVGEQSKGGMMQGSLDKYDIRKIIHYPGFNVPPPPNTYDDSEYWKVPPMSEHQSVETMIERLGDRADMGYKRQRTSLPPSTVRSAGVQDMECEETPEAAELPVDDCKFVPPLPQEDLPPPPPTELPDPDFQMEETSLSELEEQKQRLLEQLSRTPETVSRVGQVKTLDLGTPMVTRHSPYSRLPSAEKFSVDVCDVINFENLPDSTGKYKQMSGIIHNVRSKLAKLDYDI